MTNWDIMLTARPYTMTSGRNLLATIGAAKMSVRGDFVECGVWRGGHVIAALLATTQARTHWLFDTFDGMTEPGPHDIRRGSHARETTAYRKRGPRQWCRAELEEVQTNIDQYRRPDQAVRYVQGPVEDTLPVTELPEEIAVLRLDTDFYSSTLAELQHLWPRVVPGGTIIIDDYYSWDGCRRACDEYFGEDAPWQPIDGPAVRMVRA